MSAFLEWFNQQQAGTQTLLALVGTAALGAVGWLIQQALSWIRSRLTRRPEPDVVLLAPEEWTYIRWVPRERFALLYRSEPSGNARAEPLFMLKNVATDAVLEVAVRWRIEGEPIRDVFARASSLAGFFPHIDEHGLYFLYSHPDRAGSAFGVPASDDTTSTIPYLISTAQVHEQYTPLPLDHGAAWSLVFRVIAREFSFGDFGVAQGPTIRADLTYKDGSGSYRRGYLVRTRVHRCEENVGGGLCGDLVAAEHRWSGNFRGAIKFSVERAQTMGRLGRLRQLVRLRPRRS